MKHKIQLPTLEEVEFTYNKKTYDPRYTHPDAIVVADALIRKSRPNLKVLDLACGVGNIGLSLKYMHPELDLTLCDISAEALKLAKHNSKRLGLKATFKKCDMLPQGDWDMIVTNLPSYTKEQLSDSHSPKRTVLDEGLGLYKQLFDSSSAPVIVHEMQLKRQHEIELIANSRGWDKILKTDYAYAWLKHQTPFLKDYSKLIVQCALTILPYIKQYCIKFLNFSLFATFEVNKNSPFLNPMLTKVLTTFHI